VFESPLFKETVVLLKKNFFVLVQNRLLSKIFTFDVFKIAENVWFLIFYTQ